MSNRNRNVTRHVCILDDEEAIVFALAGLMRNSGYSVASFTDPREAVMGMERRVPDLLICDISMPQMSGLDFAMEATERFPNCRVLLFSGRTDARELVEDMTRHGYSFAVAMKPLHPEELIRRVRQLLDSCPGERSGNHSRPTALRLSPRLGGL